MLIDSSGRIVIVNAEIEGLFGYGREELIDQPSSLLVPAGLRVRGADHSAGLGHWPELRKAVVTRDAVARRKDGSEFPVEVRLNPIQMEDQFLVLCVLIDITERKRVEGLKDEFVSTVSHELRTPLTSIAASLGLLTGNTAIALPTSALRLISIAHSNSQRLVRLINDILDIEKMESGEIIFDMRRVAVSALLEQTIEANRGLAESKQVGLAFIDPPAEIYVNADSDRLNQVVTNLLSNAIKFSPPGADVDVSAMRANNTVRISVRDRGPGIPPSFKHRVFEKFAQADGTDTRQKGGTGLGLSIVKQIVGRLGGRVVFDDAPGGGTVFQVDLPEFGYTLETARDSEPTRCILICDDFPGMAEMLAHKLTRAGYNCETAINGAEVVSKASVKAYAAILIDLRLPDCDGISLVQQLRSQPQNRKTPIVVISGDPRDGVNDPRSAALDILGWLTKPVKIPRLASLLEQAGVSAMEARPTALSPAGF